MPITFPHKIKMDSQKKEGIYVGCESPKIIRYLDHPTWNYKKNLFIVFFMRKKFPCLVGQLNPCEDLNFNIICTSNIF